MSELIKIESPEDIKDKIPALVIQIQGALPAMIKGRDAAVAAMKNVTSIESDEDLEKVNGLLVKVRATYDKVKGLREPITQPLDQLKKLIMEFESDLDQSKDNEVSRLRGLIGAFNQKKIDAKKAADAEAARIKEKENHKVDLIARIKKNLSDMIIQRVKEVHAGADAFWKATTLETFDPREKQFMEFRVALKMDTYNKCFDIPFNSNLITKEEFEALLVEVGATETYVVWDKNHSDAVVPVVNEWRAKVPEIRKRLEDLKNASDAERARLEKEQKEKDEADQKARDQQLAVMQVESDKAIQQAADIDKTQNDFREQAMTQSIEDAGPTKLLLRFKDEKPMKAMTEILYHCFSNPKFPSIIKKNKDKTNKIDEHGFPEYVEGVDWWIKFFVANCDVNIQGIEIKEISKVVVRK